MTTENKLVHIIVSCANYVLKECGVGKNQRFNISCVENKISNSNITFTVYVWCMHEKYVYISDYVVNNFSELIKFLSQVSKSKFKGGKRQKFIFTFYQ